MHDVVFLLVCIASWQLHNEVFTCTYLEVTLTPKALANLLVQVFLKELTIYTARHLTK